MQRRGLTNIGRQIRGQARQGAERPRERPLQSSVDVLFVPQLLLELVDLAEIRTPPKRQEHTAGINGFLNSRNQD